MKHCANESDCTRLEHGGRTLVWLVLLIVLHLSLLIISATQNSVTFDEYAHLPAGVAYWNFGYRAFSIHNLSPPLLRLWAAAPVVVAGAEAPEVGPFLSQGPRDRHWNYGLAFERANVSRYQRLFVVGRLAMGVISCIGLWIVWRWAGELYGPRAGLAAGIIWAFLPDILANGSLVGTDLGTAVAMTAAIWLFGRLGRQWSIKTLAACGVAVLLAHLCKFTALLLWPVMVAMAICFVAQRAMKWKRAVASIASIALITLLGINLAYVFRGSFQSMASYSFESSTMKMLARVLPIRTPMPLPRAYLEGFDIQKHETELGVPAYLLGQSYKGTRADYYPIALACKLPAVAIALMVLSIASFLVKSKHWTSLRSDELPLLVALGVFVLGMTLLAEVNIGVRYVLPAYPLAIVLVSRVFAGVKPHPTVIPVLRWGLIAIIAIESLVVAPRWISFMNFAVGGPSRAWTIVNDSNFDWGQGLIDLKKWSDAHGNPHLVMAYFGRVDPAVYGLNYSPITSPSEHPNYVAVSSYYLLGLKHRLPTPSGPTGYLNLSYAAQLRRKQPVDRAGPTIFIYRPEDVAAAAREARETFQIRSEEPPEQQLR